MNPANLCRRCRQDFASLRLFDAHRVGLHEFTFSEGLAFEPPREDGRRCLDTDEMCARGWHLNEQGRWSDPARAARTRNYFEKAA